MYQYLHHGRAREEEREQVIENLCEKIIMENFPNLVKEIDIQGLSRKIPAIVNTMRMVCMTSM